MGEPLGRAEVQRALAEDRATTDVTTALLAEAADQAAVARFVAEEPLVVAGLPLLTTVFGELEQGVEIETQTAEGAWVDAGTTLAAVRGSARALLAGERVALNFLQRLSGVATATRRAVDAVRGTRARITHTRKTTPGLRALECYAVRIGGGVDNRRDLASAVLWKDNHWALLRESGRGLAEALARAPAHVPVMVEAESDAELETALAAGVTHILADNRTPQELARWARRVGPGVTIEASGGIGPETARAYAEAGAAVISIGALTHSARASVIRCEVTRPVLVS